MSATRAVRLAVEAHAMEARRYRAGSTPEQCMAEALEAARPYLEAEGLRKAADAWGDGTEGFPYAWLHERADAIEDTPYTEQETTNG